MNTTSMRILAATVALLAVAACSSPPTRFYTLVRPEETLAPHDAAADPYAFELEPASVPAQVDQAQLMVRVNASQLTPLEFDRWAAPLGDEIRDALSHDLSADLGVADVYKVPHAERLPVYHVQINVERFDSFPGQYALIEAAWSIRTPGPNSMPVSCRGSVSEPVGTGNGPLVEGHQKVLKEFASRMAQTIRALQARQGGSVCPG